MRGSGDTEETADQNKHNDATEKCKAKYNRHGNEIFNINRKQDETQT